MVIKGQSWPISQEESDDEELDGAKNDDVSCEEIGGLYAHLTGIV